MKKLLLILLANTMVISYANAYSPTPPLPSGFNADNTSCITNGGQLLVGTIQSNPWYVEASSSIQGVSLSHTHFTVQPLGDTNSNDLYEVAADNVFASGYDNAEINSEVPYPLTNLSVGTIVEACGLTYTQTPKQSSAIYGIHFVHINDQTIVPGSTANGWIKIIDNSGNIGDNLENNQEYLYLWD